MGRGRRQRDCIELEGSEKNMRIHLFWLDKKWKENGCCADNYNLIVDMESRTYKFYINPYYGYYRAEDIEVKRKSDILDYMEHLKKNGLTEVTEI